MTKSIEIPRKIRLFFYPQMSASGLGTVKIPRSILTVGSIFNLLKFREFDESDWPLSVKLSVKWRLAQNRATIRQTSLKLALTN